MLQDLVDGKVASLSKSQREWTDKVFEDLGLRGKVTTMAPMPKTRKQFDAPPDIWNQPKPLKPPGK